MENTETHQDLHEQQLIRREKLEALQQAGNDPFKIVKFDVTAHSAEIITRFEEMEGKTVSVAGRLMTKRLMGKASFIDIQDRDGRIQSYIRRDHLTGGEEAYDAFKRFDIGDIVGVTGEVFRTQKGEISVKATEIILLAKSLDVLPEKFHGLRDTEARYRQRYLDLIVNPEVKDVFIKRTAIVKAIRAFLDNRDYLEVDTPVLQTVSGGGTARPFLTKHNTLDMEMYMRIALELPLKRLIVGGLERVYELGRCFRNEGIDHKHNPEFIMLELYEAYTDYYGMMELVESMFKEVSQKVLGTTTVTFDGHELDFSKPFEKITMVDAVKKYSGVDFNEVKTLEAARALAKDHHLEIEARHGKGDILAMLFDEYCEKNLIQPTFVLDHPVEISPLTKRKPDNPDYTERFELYIAGMEMAHSFK